ncbi:hypothetical protein D3C83_16260 [compost metagenome]
MVGQELEALAVRRAVDDAPQRVRVFLPGQPPPKPNELVGENPTVLRRPAPLDDAIVRVGLQAGHEVDAGGGQRLEPGEIRIRLVEDENRAGRKGLAARHRPFVVLAVGDDQKGRQTPVMVEREMELDGALAPPEHGPRKAR